MKVFKYLLIINKQSRAAIRDLNNTDYNTDKLTILVSVNDK